MTAGRRRGCEIWLGLGQDLYEDTEARRNNPSNDCLADDAGMWGCVTCDPLNKVLGGGVTD